MKSREDEHRRGQQPAGEARGSTASWVSMRPSAETMRKIGTIAAEPETTEEKSRRT